MDKEKKKWKEEREVMKKAMASLEEEMRGMGEKQSKACAQCRTHALTIAHLQISLKDANEQIEVHKAIATRFQDLNAELSQRILGMKEELKEADKRMHLLASDVMRDSTPRKGTRGTATA